MPFVAAVSAMLAWLGRQGARAIAAIVFIAIAVPPVGALLKPFVTEAVFALLCLAFVRVDAATLRGYMKRPALVLAATAWTSLVLPILFGTGFLMMRLDARSPDLLLGLMLQMVAPPMMAAPAFAAVMGLDATLVLTTLITSTALTPITAPLFVHAFVGSTLTLSPLALGLKLFAIVAGSMLVGLAIRRRMGVGAIQRYSDQIDGVNILLVFVFVAAVMENVAARLWAAPLMIVGLAALAFAICLVLLGLTAFVFVKAGAERALVLGLLASQRNMALMLAATSGAVPDLTWIYFALAQFPVYLSPLLLGPFARRVIARSPK
jgi:predicted Na+-dependent transporter